MSAEVKIPAVGESITSGLLSTWHKEDGETVAAGDVLLTLETDKVSTELTAESAGQLKIRVPAGQEVKIGEVVGTIESPSAGSGPSGGAQPAPSAKAAEPAAAAPLSSPPAQTPAPAHTLEAAPVPVEPKPAAASSPAKAEPAKAEPAAKAAETKLVPAAPSASPAAASAGVTSVDGRITRKRLSPIRRKIAAQLVMAQQTAAILTTFNEVDMSAVMSLRKELQEAFTKEHGLKLGFMSFFVKAAVSALQADPRDQQPHGRRGPHPEQLLRHRRRHRHRARPRRPSRPQRRPEIVRADRARHPRLRASRRRTARSRSRT